MRYLALKLVSVSLILFSCSDDATVQPLRDDASVTSLNGTWKVVSFEDFSKGTVEYPTSENSWGRDIVVTFNDQVDPKSISGTNTTNSIFGKFDYVTDRQFIVKQLGSTYVAQPEWANKFGMAVLDGPKDFEINSSMLRVFYDNNTKSMTLERQ